MAATLSFSEASPELPPRDIRRTSGGRQLSWRSRVSGDEEAMAAAASAAMADLHLDSDTVDIEYDKKYGNSRNSGDWGNSQKVRIPDDSGEVSGKFSGKVPGKEASGNFPAPLGGLRSRRRRSFVATPPRVPSVSGTMNDHDWSSLSQDLLVMIFRQLAPRDRMESAMVCLTWHHAAATPKCWEEMDGLDWSKERVLTGFLNPIRQSAEDAEKEAGSRRVSARFSMELEREWDEEEEEEEEGEEGEENGERFLFSSSRRNGNVKGTKRVQNLNLGFNGSPESKGRREIKNGNGNGKNGNKNGSKNGYGNGNVEPTPVNPNVRNRNLNRNLTQSSDFNYNFDADMDKEMEMDLHPIAQDFLSRFESIGDRFMRKAVQLSQGSLLKLRIGHCTFAGLAAIAISCPFLEVLEVEDFLGNVNSFIMAVSGKCQYLNVLGIGLSRFVAMEDRVIEDEIVSMMINGCEDLVSVSFNGCSLSYGQAIMVAKGYPELKCFEANLGGLWAHGEEKDSLVDVLGVLSVMDYWMRSTTSSSSSLSLQRDDLLSLDSHVADPAPSSSWRLTDLDLDCLLGDRLLLHVAVRCRHLRVLRIKGARDVTDSSMKAVVSVCPFLADIDVTGVTGLTDRTLEYLGESCPELETFSCFSDPGSEIKSSTFSVEALEALITGCPRLAGLHINLPMVKQKRRGNPVEVFIALPTILTLGNLGPSLKSLRLVAPNSIHISTSSLNSSNNSSNSQKKSFECVDINSSLTVLANYCENLSSLHLEGFRNFLDWALESIVLANTGLKKIAIRGGSLTNAGAFCVAHLCHDLEFVDFSMTRVTPEIMGKFQETSWPPKQVLLCC